MPLILVSPLSDLEAMLRRYQPSHLISLLSPEFMIETPNGFPPERHLRLGINDVCDPSLGNSPPAEDHVVSLIDFSRAWDGANPLLVHCWAGISRSTAAAFAILCDRTAPGAEEGIGRELRQRAPHAYPNRLIVRLADDLLARDGKMIEAVEAMGPGSGVAEGRSVELPLDAFAS